MICVTTGFNTMFSSKVYIVDIAHIVRTWSKIHVTSEIIVLCGKFVVKTHGNGKVQRREAGAEGASFSNADVNDFAEMEAVDDSDLPF